MTTVANREFEFSKNHFNALRKMAKAYSGIHVTDDKYEMYYARLAKRLRQLKLPSFREYIALLEKDQAEFKNFINAITTNVTSFNRESHHFDILREELSRLNTRELLLWSAGCSSGQEPYSIIASVLPDCERLNMDLEIHATDLDTDVLQRAQNGVYPLDAISDYDKKIKKRFFLKGIGQHEGKCRVKKRYRDLVKYRQLNLIHRWNIQTQYSAIFCRNVMIYFDAEQKKKLIKGFAERLQPNGLLFLGHSETLPNQHEYFANIGKNVYRKK